MEELRGSGVALVTPFCQDGSIDYTSLDKIVEHVIDGGISYLVVMGTTAENATLTKKEKQDILDFVVLKNAGRLPVVFGIGGNCTNAVAQDMNDYNLSGVCAILSVTPYYNKPNQKGLYAHFAFLAKSSPLPIILYNVPCRTGVNMSADTTLKLAREFSNIVAIKDASGDLGQLSYILKDKPLDFMVISGDDNLTIPIMSLGGVGVISVSANAIPSEVSKCVSLCKDGNYIGANEVLKSILEFQDLIFCEGNPVGVKSAMTIKGLISNNLRLPLVCSSADLDSRLSSLMLRHDLM